MSLEHDFFGLLESGTPGGIYWSESVDFGDQSVQVSLSAEDADALAPDALDTAAAMTTALEDLDLRAREAMIGDLPDPSSSVSMFLTHLQEEFGEDIEDFFTHVSGDRQIDLLRSLQVIGVRFSPLGTGEDDAFVVIEYALSIDETDDVVQVSLNTRGESVGIEQD